MEKKKILVSRACDRCKLKKRRCDGLNPCSTCKKSNIVCIYSIVQKKRGPAPKSASGKNSRNKDYTDKTVDRAQDSGEKRSSNEYANDDNTTMYERCDEDLILAAPVVPLYSDLFGGLNLVPHLTISSELTVGPQSPLATEKFKFFVQSGLPNLPDDCYMDIIGCYFMFFNKIVPIFHEGTFLSDLLNSDDTSVPLCLVAAICSIGCIYSRHPALSEYSKFSVSDRSNQFFTIASSTLPQNFHSFSDKIYISQCSLLLTMHDLGVRGAESAWVWNGIGIQVIKESFSNVEEILQVNECAQILHRLWFSCYIVDFLHSLASGLLMAVQDEDVPYFQRNLPTCCEKPVFLEKLFPLKIHTFQDSELDLSNDELLCEFNNVKMLVCLIRTGRKVIEQLSSQTPIIELHMELVKWWDKLESEYKLVPSLEALAAGGRSLFGTESKGQTSRPIPSVVTINLIFFGILAILHQHNFKLENEKNSSRQSIALASKIDPMTHYLMPNASVSSALFSMSIASNPYSLKSSLDVLVACYRAQCSILKNLCHDKDADCSYYQACVAPIMHTLVLPSVLPLLQVPQYAAVLVMDLRSTQSSFSAHNPFTLHSLDAVIFPAMTKASQLWPSLGNCVVSLTRLVHKVRSDLVGFSSTRAVRVKQQEQFDSPFDLTPTLNSLFPTHKTHVTPGMTLARQLGETNQTSVMFDTTLQGETLANHPTNSITLSSTLATSGYDVISAGFSQSEKVENEWNDIVNQMLEANEKEMTSMNLLKNQSLQANRPTTPSSVFTRCDEESNQDAFNFDSLFSPTFD